MSVDDLFRKALLPIAEERPPEGMWRRLVLAIEQDQETESKLLVRRGQVLFWIDSFQNACKYASDAFICAQPYGLYRPILWGRMLA